MRWKWPEVTSKWLLGSYCDYTEPITLEPGAMSCIFSKHVAYKAYRSGVS